MSYRYWLDTYIVFTCKTCSIIWKRFIRLIEEPDSDPNESVLLLNIQYTALTDLKAAAIDKNISKAFNWYSNYVFVHSISNQKNPRPEPFLLSPKICWCLLVRISRSYVVSWLGFWDSSARWALPDEPFHNFRASRSGDRQMLCSSGTSCDGFWSSKIVKGFVGYLTGEKNNLTVSDLEDQQELLVCKVIELVGLAG